MKTVLLTKWKKLLTIAVSALFLFYIGSSLVIGSQVQDVISAAQKNHPTDPNSALLAVVNSENLPLAERNQAVWALGQLGDPQAISSLQALYTGKECDHDNEVCQHELEKALKLCQGSQNIGALIWRHGEITSPSVQPVN